MNSEAHKLRGGIIDIYKKCGSPEKPKAEMVRGMYGSCTYRDKVLSNEQMIKFILRCEMLNPQSTKIVNDKIVDKKPVDKNQRNKRKQSIKEDNHKI